MEFRDYIQPFPLSRKESKLTQEAVAKKLNCSQSYISKVEAGELRVGVVELNQFAKLYDKSVEYFLK